MSYYTAHLDRDIERYLTDESEWESKRPVCSECGQAIPVGMVRYRIRNELFCEDCIENFRTYDDMGEDYI